MHNKEFCRNLFFLIDGGIKSIFLPYFVSMMVNLCNHNYLRAHVFPLHFFRVRPHWWLRQHWQRVQLNTNEHCSRRCGCSEMLSSAERFRPCSLSWAFHFKGGKNAVAERGSRPQYQRAALKSKPFRAWSVQTSTFAAVEVFWHLRSPECRMNQLWHCTMFIVFHPYFPKCGDVWKHLKRVCQQGVYGFHLRVECVCAKLQ